MDLPLVCSSSHPLALIFSPLILHSPFRQWAHELRVVHDEGGVLAVGFKEVTHLQHITQHMREVYGGLASPNTLITAITHDHTHVHTFIHALTQASTSTHARPQTDTYPNQHIHIHTHSRTLT
jgi:hypothetical protein